MTDAASVTIRRDFLRPDPGAVANFAKTPTGYVVDARGRRGALDPGIVALFEAPRFAGEVIEAGDVVVGDRDGVVVVPRASVDEALDALESIYAKEAGVEKAIADGAKWPAWLDEVLAAKGVRVVE